jgi:hypothetical protein
MSTPARLLVAIVLGLPALAAAAEDGFDFGVPGLPPPSPAAEPVLREVLAPGSFPFSPWAPDFRPGNDPLKAGSQNDGLFGSLTGQQTVREGYFGIAREDPLTKPGWQADEAWKLNLAGPLFVFGQLSAGAEEALQQDAHVNGRTGVAWQVPIPAFELLFRGGPTVSYTDPLRPDRTKEKSELLLEVQGRCPLLFGVQLEYQGSASPALSPLDHDWVSHELRLALPVGSAGTLKLGARQRWDNVVEQRTTTEVGELFLGLELKH